MLAATPGLALLPEIIILIAECLGDDVRSISNLYQADKTTRRTLSSHLYRSVRLKSANSVTSLCQMTTNFRPDELGNIRSLQIGPDWSKHSAGSKIQSNLVPSLRSALEAMPRILSLSLYMTPSALYGLLEGFEPPFQLTEFIHSGELSPPLAGFLEKQPSILKLGWHSLFLEEQCDYLSSLLEDSRTILQMLGELAGPMPLLSVLLPRRPVTKIQVMYHTLSFLRLESPMAAFSHPMGRLSSLCMMEYRPTWQSFTALISKLEVTCVRNTLREVHIVEAFTGSSMLTRRNLIRTHATRLAVFDSLEHVEISRTPDMTVFPQVVYEQLRSSGMDRVSTWRTIIPSLRSVTIHGHKLC
ncbi:hypothetical protein RSAG8_04084, partial [Rhizoctonia solani AG-8 WAC10335]